MTAESTTLTLMIAADDPNQATALGEMLHNIRPDLRITSFAESPSLEMADMAAAGMTPMQVIVAATRNGAQFLKLTDTGTIEAKKSADFLVLDANPLDDITNTRRISSVYLRGTSVERSSYK